MTELEKAIMSDNETEDEATAVTETIEETITTVETVTNDNSDVISEEEKTVHIEINRIKKMNP